jgi:flagellar biosynthesis protein FlhB
MAAGASEKTEQPTPRRMAEARRRGEIAHSRELSSAVVLCAVVALASLAARSWFGSLLLAFHTALGDATRAPAFAVAGERALWTLVRTLAPPLALAVVAAVAIGLLQSRGVLAPGRVSLDWQRLLPRWDRVLGAAALAEVGRGLVKVAVAAGVAWLALHLALPALVHLAGASPGGVLAALAAYAQRLAARMALAALVLGIADYLWQRRRHLQALRMTREEVRREHRDTEGDPHHKAARQRLHRELVEQRMVADVRRADFVVVNPDHIAVAVRYDRDGGAAPVVVAKGERLLAERIKEVARAAGVPIFRDVTLARSLRAVEEGDEIPEALYEAVAELLRVLQTAQAGHAAREAASPESAPAPAGSWIRG